MVDTHYDLSDASFLESFANASLAPDLFTHEAHLRLAWLHLRQHGLQAALLSISRDINKYVAALGAQDKYHATVTLAAVQIVHHFSRNSRYGDFNSFLSANPQLKNSFKNLLESHYSSDLLNSPLAKESYMTPDLLPFD